MLKEIMKKKLNDLYTVNDPFLLLMVCCILLIATFSASANGNVEGPLLFQVHYANPVSSLTEKQAVSMLEGSSGTEVGLKSDLNIYVDKNIAKLLAAEYKTVKFIECDAENDPPSADKNALLVSDARGLVPSMKLVAVNKRLPWGELKENYAINENVKYPLLKTYAEPWNEDLHISIVQTGVTAMSRNFMEVVDKHRNLARPTANVRHIPLNANLAMTSNEVSFADKCKYPLPDRMQFCTPWKYYTILKEAGFGVIELTGNHNNDYGADANKDTMNFYEKEGVRFFGGGRNKEEAEAVLYVKIKDVTFAFTGSNQWGPDYAWATDATAGAAKFSPELFKESVKKAVKNADVVFVTVQWGNEDNPVPHKEQIEYFHAAADLGAHIMVSSSAHRAMGIEFYNNRFISYGLGNFLFDQMQTVNHRRGLIARHHFYGKRHVQTELIPYLLYNHSEPRIVKGKDATELFDYVFKYSIGDAFSD